MNRPASPLAWIDEQVRALLTAVRFLTRIPVPGGLAGNMATYQDDLRRSVPYFPLVGMMVGVITITAVGTADRFWFFPLALLLGLGVELFVTGAFHEDAVADFYDAFGGGWSREDVLRIFRDSRLGSYGVLGVTASFAVRYGAILACGHAWAVAVLASSTLGRLAYLYLMLRLEPIASPDGLAKEVGSRLSFGGLLVGLLFSLPGSLPLAIFLPFHAAVAAVLILVLCEGARSYLQERIGGVTGDCLGWTCYQAQLIVLLAAANANHAVNGG